VSIDEIVQNMSRMVGRLILDRTGLQGRYDIDLKFSPETDLTVPPTAAVERPPDASPSLFVALEDQLGLRLEPQRAPVNVVVVDSIQRPAED